MNAHTSDGVAGPSYPSTTPAEQIAIRVVRPGREEGLMPQGILGFKAISRETLGSVGIFMAWHRVPPGARSSLHSHANFEIAVYVLGDRGYAYYGEGLGGYVEARPGNVVYIPADLAHGVGCPAGGEALEYVVARNVPEEVVVTLREAHESPIGLDGETREARRTPEAERKETDDGGGSKIG